MISIRTIVVFFSFFVFCNEVSGQELLHQFAEKYNSATSDPLGNFYLLKNDQVKKTDKQGAVLFSFADPVLGNISWIDASDPFRILVYYKSFNQILFLDRTLSPLGDPVKLDELEIFDPVAVSRSSQGGFWVVDRSSSSLILLDNNLETRLNARLTGLDANSGISWYPMIEWKERLYLCHPGKTIQQFDLFGNRLKNIPAEAFSIGISDNRLLFTGYREIYFYEEIPGKLSDPIIPGLPEWEHLIISKDIALISSQSGWQLIRLKKTF